MMRYILFFLAFAPLGLLAQENVPATSQLTIEGMVKNGKTFTIEQLNALPSFSLDSIPIFNHKMEHRKTLKKLRMVLLKDILAQVEFDVPGPKWLSEFYITCVASDNYKAVFSWNEVFNTEPGKKIGIIIEENGKKLANLDDRIALISPTDQATGRRYVKGLSRIIIKRVE